MTSLATSWVDRVATRLGTVGELLRLFVKSGRWGLVPLVVVMMVMGVLVMAVQVIEYVAPFVYSLF